MWKFPWPETQQCPNASVHVKVADYGISKKISPMGICGIQGTTPYLPPEVILYGGREPYSTKVDVYAFGMFIYYLTSFRAPFDNNGNPISAILGEGKRPELSLKVNSMIHVHQPIVASYSFIQSWNQLICSGTYIRTIWGGGGGGGSGESLLISIWYDLGNAMYLNKKSSEWWYVWPWPYLL